MMLTRLARQCWACLALLACALPLAAQPSEAEQEAIFDEAMELFHLEMAAWQSTDAVLTQEANGQSDGYLSYRDGDSLRTIFYASADPAQVVVEVALDAQADLTTLRMQARPRASTPQERTLITMRENLLDVCKADTKDFFKLYKNTGMNILLLPGPQPIAYMLTAPNEPGVMLFGNDYRFEFDAAGKVLRYTCLHQDLVAIALEEGEEASAHAHQKGDAPMITSTDICTLLLYGHSSTWKSHVAYSPKYVSVWDLEDRKLGIITQKAWKRIAADQAKRQ